MSKKMYTYEWAQKTAAITLEVNGHQVYNAEGRFSANDLVFTGNDREIGKNFLVFGDVKGKTSSTYTRMKNSEDHGIDKDYYDYYCERAKELGTIGVIVVVELNREISENHFVPSYRVLLFKLDDIYRTNIITANYGTGGMVYWHRNDRIAEYDIPNDLR